MTSENSNTAQSEAVLESKPIVEEKTRKNGGVGLSVFTFLLSVVISTIGGAAGGYYAALSIPVPNQVMVFDLNGLTRKAVEMASKGVAGGDPVKVGDELLARAHKVMDEYKEMGVVIIDREMVVDAPKHLIINYEEPVAETGDGKGSSQSDMAARLKDLEKQLEKARVN